MAEKQQPAPTHHLYVVIKPTGGEEFLFKIGDAVPIADGSGFKIRVQILPVDGEMLLQKAP